MIQRWSRIHVQSSETLRLLKSYTIYLINALNCANVTSMISKIVLKRRTSAVHDPELDGWKKLSVEAIILASESSALDPAR